jgi:hypothetical protein
MSSRLSMSMLVVLVWTAFAAHSDDQAGAGGGGPAPTPQQNAFAAGAGMGKQGTAGLFNGITYDNAQANVPNYSNTAPEASDYGLSDLVAPRNDKISGCANAQLNTVNRTDQECIAVNFMRAEQSLRPKFTLDPSTDPTITRANTIIADPSQYAGNLSGTYTDCNTVSSTSNPTYEVDTCHEYAQSDTLTCNKRAVVTVQNMNALPNDIRVSQETYLSSSSSLFADVTYSIFLNAPNSDGAYSVSVSAYVDAAAIGFNLASDSVSLNIAGTVVNCTSGAPTVYSSPLTGMLYGNYVCSPSVVQVDLTAPLSIKVTGSHLPQYYFDSATALHNQNLVTAAHGSLILLHDGAIRPLSDLVDSINLSVCPLGFRNYNIFGNPELVCGWLYLYGTSDPINDTAIFVTDTFVHGSAMYGGFGSVFVVAPRVGVSGNVVSWTSDCDELDRRSQ